MNLINNYFINVYLEIMNACINGGKASISSIYLSNNGQPTEHIDTNISNYQKDWLGLVVSFNCLGTAIFLRKRQEK